MSTAPDLRQNVLDEQRAPVDRALHRRVVAAVARAKQAYQRANKPLRRVETFERRQETRT